VDRIELSRITAFSDSVMAVAITLLVLNVNSPTVPASQLPERLDDLLTPLAAYALSFALVGRFWIIHHRHFASLHDFDGTLMTLNLLFLGLIVLIPFSTNLMSDYSEVPEAAAVFSTTIALASLANWTMVAYTLRRGYVSEELMHQARPYGNWLGLSFTALFLVSIPAAFIDTTVAQVLWVSAIVVRYPLRRVADRASQTSA